LDLLENVIPGLRSLRSLTRGYYLPPLRGSLSVDGRVELMIASFRFVHSNAANNSLGNRLSVNRQRQVTFLLGLFLSVLACGSQLSQTKGHEDQSFVIDQMIDVGGYRLYINCTGNPVNGSPTVVMDAGGYDSSETWNKVAPDIAKFARVCVYDRAGLGKSERQPNPSYPSQEVVKDLHTLLVNAHIVPPLILGWSFVWGHECTSLRE